VVNLPHNFIDLYRANREQTSNFSPAFETNPLKIKLSITWRGIQPGLKILARYIQLTGPGFSARPNGPENLRKNSHVIATKFQPG